MLIERVDILMVGREAFLDLFYSDLILVIVYYDILSMSSCSSSKQNCFVSSWNCSRGSVGLFSRLVYMALLF